MAEIVLVTGGAKSGKSVFAENLCTKRNNNTGYIATSIPFDDDMKDKIEKHRKRRSDRWVTYECYRNIDINGISEDCETVMLDCVTLMVNNLMFDFCENPDELKGKELDEMENFITDQFTKLLADIEKTNLYFVFVTNETGMGVIPANRLSRIYSNISGKINQIIASKSDEVYLTVSGIPVKIKGKGVAVYE